MWLSSLTIGTKVVCGILNFRGVMYLKKVHDIYIYIIYDIWYMIDDIYVYIYITSLIKSCTKTLCFLETICLCIYMYIYIY